MYIELIKNGKSMHKSLAWLPFVPRKSLKLEHFCENAARLECTKFHWAAAILTFIRALWREKLL